MMSQLKLPVTVVLFVALLVGLEKTGVLVPSRAALGRRSPKRGDVASRELRTIWRAMGLPADVLRVINDDVEQSPASNSGESFEPDDQKRVNPATRTGNGRRHACRGKRHRRRQERGPRGT